MSIISEARELRAQFVKLREMATDEMSLQVPNLYPTWRAEAEYAVGDRVLYNDVLYKVLQVHTSQVDWTPDVATSLFAKVLIPDENIIPEWEQPDSTNPYMIGDKVMYDGKTWVSIVDNNVWAPDAYGWTEVVMK
jgi:chitodextrinase